MKEHPEKEVVLIGSGWGRAFCGIDPQFYCARKKTPELAGLFNTRMANTPLLVSINPLVHVGLRQL